MRNFILGFLFSLVLSSPKIDAGEMNVHMRETYTREAIVYSLEYNDDAVIVETLDGELWEFYGCEDWFVNDICVLTFKDAGIPGYIWDDEIVNARYVGYRATLE